MAERPLTDADRDRAASAMRQHEGCGSRVSVDDAAFGCGFVYRFREGDDFGHARRAHLVGAVLAALPGTPEPPEGTTVTEWGVRDVESKHVAADSVTTQDGGEFQRTYLAEGVADGEPPEELVTRQRTTYADTVTDWQPAEPARTNQHDG